MLASSKNVVFIISKLPPQIYDAMKTMGSRGLSLLSDGLNKLVIVVKNIHGQVEKLAKILNDRAVQILKEINPNMVTDEVLLDLGNVQVKSGENILSRNLQIVKKTGDGQVFVRSVRSADEIAANFPNLASKFNDWAHLNLTYEYVDDYVRVFSPSGVEIGKFIKEGGDEIFEIADDYFTVPGSGGATAISGITVKTSSGEIISGAGFVQNGNAINFVEDVTAYGNDIVQNAIKNRGTLRQNIPGILPGQEAHHIIPVQLLKENDVVKKAVEGGFDFNSIDNGMALDKYSSKTGLGRHGPHKYYTDQIRDYIDLVWKPANPNFSNLDAKNMLTGLVEDLRSIIESTTERINLLELGLM